MKKKLGKYIVYTDGMIEDTANRLMWSNRDNGKNITWTDARNFCNEYKEGGYTDWRLPTVQELEQLHIDFFSTNKIKSGQPVSLSKTYLWSNKTKGDEAAFFYFDTGDELWFRKGHSRYLRVLPVRNVD